MVQYTLLDPLTGDTHTLCERDLTRNLRLNVILLRGDEHVGIVTHQDIVLFCRWCAGPRLSRCRTIPPEARTVLKLVDKWLVDPGSVSSEELNQVALAAWAVADAAQTAIVAWAAVDAARGADAADIAQNAGISYQAQAQWLLEHLRSAQ